MNEERQIQPGKTYTCKRMRLMCYLADNGFFPYATVRDVENPKFKCWKYSNSVELEDTINRYFDELKQKNH